MNKVNSFLGNIPESHKIIRQQIHSFVLKDAMGWHKEWLSCLYNYWERWNKEFFDGELVVPCIFIAEPKTPRALADCAPISAFGARSQIRIRPALVLGKHKCINPNAPKEGKILFLADVLLHEMVHQWQEEVLGDDEKAYKGHGPKFADKCNSIGNLLGLDKVRLAKCRGKNRDLPSCAHWPSIVRPSVHYLGAFIQESVPQQQKGSKSKKSMNENAIAMSQVEDLIARFQSLKEQHRIQAFERLQELMK